MTLHTFQLPRLLSSMDDTSRAYKLLESAERIDMGSFLGTQELANSSTLEFYDLPFDNCLFQVTCEDGAIFLYHAVKWWLHARGKSRDHYADFLLNSGRNYDKENINKYGDTALWTMYSNHDGALQPCLLQVNITQDGGIVFFTPKGRPRYIAGKYNFDDLFVVNQQLTIENIVTGPNKDIFMPIFSSIFQCASAIEVFSCSNVVMRDNEAPKKLNKKRIKKGKLPFLSYKTLHIKVSKEISRSQNQGGTHASPRVHMRRGHIRKLSEDRRVWVNSCVVGAVTGAAKGRVIHDYVVDAATQ